jgi:peptidyl-prolyl cis-trans isomerase A (cyclophilin A)
MSRKLLLSFTLLAIACDPSRGPGAAAAAAGETPPADAAVAKSARAPADPKLLDPYAAEEEAPPVYKVKLDTTKGDVVIEVHREWAPRGADRFYNLVKLGFFDDVAFFRAIPKFMVQFGIHGHPDVSKAWKTATLKDDRRIQPNAKGSISFANSGKDTRSTQVFINYNDNTPLDPMGFAPFGKVIEGMGVVETLYQGYGEGEPKGPGPDQRKIERDGNEYLRKSFPKLDWIEHATLMP